MNIEIFVDETGTVGNSDLKEDYGLGWVTAPSDRIVEIEDLLSKNGLGAIHVKEARARKIKLANRISKLRLDAFGVTGGALIRKDHNFSATIAKESIFKTIANNPKLFIESIEQVGPGLKVASLEELAPDVFSRSLKRVRLQELAGLATRYPVLTTLKKYGVEVGLNIRLSAHRDAKAHRKTVEPSTEILISGLNELLHALAPTIGLKQPRGPFGISVRVEARSNGMFGLADYFAYTARMFASSNPKEKELGRSLYECNQNLFSDRLFREDIEPLPGVFVRV